MTTDEAELRRIFTSASLGQSAYRTWAQQARRERNFNIARLFEALNAAKLARADHAFRLLGEVGSTARNVERALGGMEPEAIATGPITGSSALARDLLARAQYALSQNRDLLASEMGDLFVCSTCGNLCEYVLTGACPICGTVPAQLADPSGVRESGRDGEPRQFTSRTGRRSRASPVPSSEHC